jgi:hypothetical protein
VTGSDSDGMSEKEIEAAHFSETSVGIYHITAQETVYFIITVMRTSDLTDLIWYVRA